MATRVGLLGWLTVEDGELGPRPPTGKTAAILAYLAYRRSWCSRGELVDLLWPGRTEARGRSNLRSLLSRGVRRLPFTTDLEVEDERLRWSVETDVAEFRLALRGEEWGRATSLYTGELLTGFWFDDSPSFADWLESERHALHSSWREAVFRFADDLGAAGDWGTAAEVLGRVCTADPLDEEARRRRMLALQRSGRLAAAFSDYQLFKARLDEELGVEPEPATSSLAGAMKAAGEEEWLSKAAAPRASVRRHSPTRLPAAATPLLGRDRELSKASGLLRDDACRLLTLVGAGGVGKSRLALAAAHELAGEFREGVYYVPVMTVVEPRQLVYAIADALSLKLGGSGEAESQLVEALADDELLIVVDNFEQLLPHTRLIQRLLEETAGTKLLVTSRQRLDLQREHLLDLRGLAAPPDGTTRASEFDAVKLFQACALRSRLDFEAHEDALEDIARICRLVDGLPLAIELAASWVRVVSTSDIRAEIEKGLEILQAPLRDLPERHQNIRAVFDYSWRVLTAAEQEVLEKLAVFQGNFSRDAAEQVAGASLPLLSGLVNKSLVRSTGERLQLHPLIRQYLLAKLDSDADKAHQAREAHSEYYGRLLSRNGTSPVQPVDTLDEIAVEFENVRAAWSWAIAFDRIERIGAQAPTMANFYMYRSRYHEWRELFGDAVASVRSGTRNPGRDLVLAFLLTHLGWCNYRLGRFDESEAVARESAGIYDRLDVPPVQGPASDPLLTLGLLAVTRGDYSAAMQHGDSALRRATANGHLHNQSVALHVLSGAAIGQEEYAGGLERSKASYRIALRLGDRWHMGNCLIDHGLASRGLGDFEAAGGFLKGSYRIFADFDDRGGMAQALAELGGLAVAQHALDEARDYFQRSLELNEQVLEGKALVKSLCGLGDCCAAAGELAEASDHYRRALVGATRMHSVLLTRPVAEGITRLLTRAGRESTARALLPLVAEVVQPEWEELSARALEALELLDSKV